MPSDPWFNSYLPGSDPREIGVSTSKDVERQIYGSAGAPPRCFCSHSPPHWSIWRGGVGLGREKGKGFSWSQLLWSVLGDLEGGLALREAGPTAKAPDGVEGNTTSTDKV